MSIEEQNASNESDERNVFDNHKIVSQSEWMEARKNLLNKEKKFSFFVINLIKRSQIYHGFKLIKRMYLMDPPENKICQNFLMAEVN